MKCHFLQTPFVTILERGMKGWIMGGIAREAPKSLSLQNRTVYLPTRYFHKFLFHPLYLRFIIGNNTNILFFFFNFSVDFIIYKVNAFFS